MNNIFLKLKSKIKDDLLTFYEGGDVPALESLYFHYTQCHCMQDIHESVSLV